MAREYKLSREEMETTARTSVASHEWDIVTSDPRMIRYLRRQGYEPRPDHQLSGYVSFLVPFRKLRIRKREINRVVTEKARMAIRFNSTSKKVAILEDKTQWKGSS